VKDLGLTYEDLRSAAGMLLKYAQAVEAKLYIDMKVEDAHKTIDEAERLADLLEDAADKLDTVSPVDLG